MKTKILIIEDHEHVRENTKELLELAGYRVFSCADGPCGIEKARQLEPDLILCDIMMPGMDGYQVLNTLQQDSVTGTIPFIFLTAKTEREDQRKGMNMGADDYLTKPFEEHELLEAVRARLKKHHFTGQEFGKDLEGLSKLMEQASAYLDLDYVERTYYCKSYPAREMLFMEGDAAHSLYYVLKGRVKVYKSTEAGKELVTGILGAGDFIGSLSLVNPEGRYLETAIITEEAEIYSIPKADFIHLLDHDTAVLHKFMEVLSKDLMDKQEQLIQMAYCPVKQRLARTLLKLQESKRNETNNYRGIEIAREDLAGMVGTATETIIRALSELRDNGIVTVGKFRRIIINDPNRLRDLADY